MQRLLPDAGVTTIAEQTAGFDPIAAAGEGRPHVFTNFAVTVDGHATISGRSGEIGSDTDTAMLMALRERAEAVLVGAGTVRAESYGRLLPGAERRRVREQAGLAADPLAVIVSNRLALPWDAGLFSSGAGRVLIFTASAEEPPATATPLEVIRHPGAVDLRLALEHLRVARGIRALLCEGGPHLHGALLDAGLVDELFVTFGARRAGGPGPRMAEGLETGPLELELRWLLQEGDELFARYGVRRAAS
jgi:riboflavin biosynthesis pyrimidine reductase